MRTFVPLKDTSRPLSWRVETDIKFFFNPGTYNTSLNEMGGILSL
jgi:hypothetical protein